MIPEDVLSAVILLVASTMAVTVFILLGSRVKESNEKEIKGDVDALRNEIRELMNEVRELRKEIAELKKELTEEP